jgi:membrane-bound inhibitor of C-type lysozyme
MRLKLDQVTAAGPAQALSETPDFVCRGNEPFWNLELRKERLQFSRLRDEIESRVYAGQFSRYSALNGGAGYQWQGLAKEGVDSTLVAEITLDYCVDSMAGPEEGGEYDYRISVGVDDEVLEGCCGLLVVESPKSAVIYQCADQQRISAYFEGVGTQASVRLLGLNGGSGRGLQLPIQESASGARYAEAGNEFWSKGSEARLTLEDDTVLACQVAESVVSYQCDDEQTLSVRYQVNTAGGFVSLNMADGSELLLPQRPAASGTRYAEGENEFWSNGAGARLTLQDADPVNCTER